MFQSIIKYFKTNFFDISLPFEYRIHMIFFLESCVLSFISFTANFFLGAGFWGIVVQGIYNCIAIVVILLPTNMRMRIFKPLLIFIVFLYLPYMYFPTAGYKGTSMFFAILGIFMLCVIFKGKTRIFLVTLNTLMYLVFALLQYRFPGLITPFANETAQLLDLIVAAILCFIGMAILTTYFSKTHQQQLHSIESLLRTLEHNNKALEEMNNLDSLTGAYSRRYVTDYLKGELASNRLTSTNLCLLLMDLDSFKSINDTYGHNFGDQVLIRFTTAVKQQLRKYDVFSRYGGEEFLAVLNHVDIDEAFLIAERIREAVAQITFENGLKLSVSIGLVQSRADEEIDALIGRSDTCLYAAKKEGRNKVVMQK